MVHFPPRSVLIVDDNTLVRRILRQLFASQPDFDVRGEAGNGQEAIDKAQERQPDLIVIDLSMPVMNGLEASRALKRLIPDVPIIMFSEYCEALSEKEARAAGIAALVSKSEVSKLIGTARGLFGRMAA